jgi:hypothetical protein
MTLLANVHRLGLETLAAALAPTTEKQTFLGTTDLRTELSLLARNMSCLAERVTAIEGRLTLIECLLD